MNRVWKIIEERKSSSGGNSERYGGMYSGKRMYGRKESDSYEDGVMDGICAAITVLEEHVKDMQKD